MCMKGAALAASAKDSRRIAADRDAITAGLRYALRRLPVVRVVWSDGDPLVACVTGMNPWSWGERVKIRLGDGGELSVESTCRFPLQVFDSGKNERNVQLIYEWIEEYLELFTDHRAARP
jgi:hypothetical protein